MTSQQNAGQQYDKLHAVTIVATARVEALRFIAYDGAHADANGAARDSQGVTETGAETGAAVSAITAYSGLVEAAEPIAQFDFVKPAADGSGRAIVGDAGEHCGRALGEALEAGAVFEVQLLTHVHVAG